MNILISPGHYFFSNKFGSEPSWAVNLVTKIPDRDTKVDVIVGVNDLDEKTSIDAKIIQIYKSRSTHPLIELIKYLFFYPLVTLQSIILFSKKSYDVIHHLMPTSLYTINPMFLIVRLFYPKTKIIIGPLQLPQQKGSFKDLNLMLVGKSSEGIFNLGIYYFFKFLLVVIRPFSRMSFQLCDTIVCNSLTSKKFHSQWVDENKIKVIPTGINTSTDSFELNRKLSTKQIKVLCVGQLTQRKGQMFLLEAVNQLVNEKVPIYLTLAGEGDQEQKYTDFITKHNLTKNVTLLGKISSEKMPEIYKTHDIFCLPSVSDSSPTVILEAMNAGLPIIASDVGAIKEMLGNDGLLVAPENSQAIITAIQQLLSNPNLYRDLAIRGAKRVKSKYSWSVIASAWRKLYELS